MKKMILALLTLSIVTTAFAQRASARTTTLNCKSANYTIVVNDLEAFSFANFGTNGVMNSGADVEVGESYISNKVIALSLTVDGKLGKFEVSVSKEKANLYSGKLFTGAVSQKLNCTRL